MPLLMLSNMWPHKDNMSSGTFVKKMSEQLEAEGTLEVITCVLRPHRFKIVAYLSFYFRCCLAMISVREYVLYCHFISHTGILALIGTHVFRKRLILNCHGSDVVVPAKTGGIVHKLNRLVLRSAHKVIVPSRFFSGLLQEKFGLRQEDLYIYPSGGVVYPNEIPQRGATWQEDGLTFGYVGSLSESKGLRIITSSMNQVSFPCRLRVAGSGAVDLLQAIKNPLVELIYYGVLSREELNQFYQSIDVLLFPTLLEESLGLSPIEAMAFGVPVIASEIGAVSEYVVDGKNGFLVSPGSAEDFYLALSRFRNLSAAEYSSLRQCARMVAASYDETLVAKDYRLAVREICDAA